MKGQFKSKRNTFFSRIIFSLVVFFAFLFLYLFPEVLQNIFSFAWETKKNISISALDSQQLYEENKQLSDKISFYENEDNLLYMYALENKKLKEQLQYQNFLGTERKVFSLQNSTFSNMYSNLLIHDPTEWVKKGDLVFSGFNMLIGEVAEVQASSASIALFSSWGQKNTFYLADSGIVKIEVEAVGQGSGVLQVEAPRDIEFTDVRKVFLVSKQNTGYVVAQLVDQQFQTQDTVKTLYFKTLANENLLSQVVLEKNVPKSTEIFIEKMPSEEKN